MEQYLQQLVSFFSRVERQEKLDGLYGRLTAIGQPFVASDLRLVARGLGELKLCGYLDSSRVFCDAGCADGRIVALAAACFGMPALGIEYDHRLVTVGQRNIGRLQALGIIGEVPLRILEGNFCNEDTYRSFDFRNVATFYCFESNCCCLANKIVKDSLKGTLFVYYTQNAEAHFGGLRRLRTIPLQTPSNQLYFMHAFMKSAETAQ